MRMLKNYKDFLFEEGLDLGGLGGDQKKESPPDPEKEIAKEKEKKRKAAQKERGEELDKAEAEVREILPKTPQDFRDKFEKRILDAIDNDDRVEYHDLVLDIQTYQIPMAQNQEGDQIDATAPIIKVIQGLNKNEYRG
jgi:hypothetical protein